MTGPGEARLSKSAANAITLDGAACGNATKANTNTIKVLGDGGSQTLEIDLATPFLGGTSEGSAATSEIEIQAVLADGSDTLLFMGGAAANAWRIGTTGLNHNADADGNDVEWSGVEMFDAYGRAGNDVISAGGGLGTGGPLGRMISIYGGPGNDAVTGGAKSDTLSGDHDEPYVAPTSGGSDTISGGEGSDTLTGGPASDTLNGDDEGDFMCGSAGDDTLYGGAGHDYFDPQYYGTCGANATDGADTFNGGSGRDQVSYALRSQNVHVTLDNVANDGADTSSPANATADEGDNIRVDVEDIEGGSGNDVLNANTPAANAAGSVNAIRGNEGADKIYGGVNEDHLEGSNGIDTILGGPENDSIYAGDDNDVIRGGDGNDYLDGSAGKDHVSGDAGSDELLQSSSIDTGDTLSGGTGPDRLSYGARTHTLRISLDNVANDGADADNSGTAEEIDNVKSDIEEIRTGSGNDVINANTPAANSAGLNNYLDGGAGNDNIWGGAGEDQLHGLDGTDTLVGGPGEDYMTGGAHADKFTAADGYYDRVDGGLGDGATDTGTFDPYDAKMNFE